MVLEGIFTRLWHEGSIPQRMPVCQTAVCDVYRRMNEAFAMPIKNRSGYVIAVTYIDDCERLLVEPIKWHLTANGYCCHYSRSADSVARFGKVSMPLHRLIMSTPDGMETDHINGIKLDNRRDNLRIVTRSQNQRNRKVNKNNMSGFKGVHLQPDGTYTACIFLNKKLVTLGHFSDVLDARNAYANAAKENFGQYAGFL